MILRGPVGVYNAGPMKLYRTRDGAVLESGGRSRLLPGADWDDLFNRADPASAFEGAGETDFDPATALAPLVSQEVWAAGVTYYRSRDARMEESKEAGGGDFYAKVYDADRPELFFKATPHRTVGPGGTVRVRRDSRWNVPEPELAVAVNREGRIFGYTICNDMSSRDIEGANPLYLPQAKVYDGSCALGPGLLLAAGPLPAATEIGLEIRRAGDVVFGGRVALTQLKRPPEDLVGWLLRDNSFPRGCYLSTGTGIIPPPEFSLQPGDEVRITIPPVGTLVNPVA